ncbi:MAG: alpha/beta fold hydrolase [Candidatus Thermoplasmatota archaeon]|nr:alpha/beta fold hydrolase [Candidatus Thermoplasmatota archaeon]
MDTPQWLDDLMPFERRVVDVDGVGMSVVDDGPRDAEETVVFLHGNPAWSLLWRHLLGPVKEAGHRVIAPDMIGLGLSEKPLSPAYHALWRHVENLKELILKLDLEGITLVLHDWGGPVGMGAAVAMPERIERIVIANTVAFAPRTQRSLSRWHKAMASPVGSFFGEHLNLVAHSAFRFGVNERLDPQARKGYLYPFKERGARLAAQAMVEMVPDGPDHPTAGTLRKIQAGYHLLQDKPMQVLWADRDPVMRPVLARKWQEAFPEADVRHVSETAGHFWQEDDPEPFLDAILGFVSGGKP